MKDVIKALEEIEKSAKSGDRARIEKALRSSLSAVIKMHPRGAKLEQLQNELSVWQAKLDVILKEPAGREGMVKHAKHWIEQLHARNDIKGSYVG